MNFDPQKFFIGMMDFFSVLLPGMLLTFVLMDYAGPSVLGARYEDLKGAEAWGIFLFTSYLLGHFVFLLGSQLDDLYDWARRYTFNKQISLLARRGYLLPWYARLLIWMAFQKERNLAVNRAAKIKRQALEALQAQDAINTFQWAKAFLNAECPASLAVIQRFEADSKFFRCFTVVLVIVLIAWPFQQEWPRAAVLIVVAMLALALWRYMEQRLKATNQAYWSAIAVTARNGKIVLEKPEPVEGNPTHAGGVVFRVRHNKAEYLLVEAKDDPTQWVLPKGHVEEDEQLKETAVREVQEETGVWASIVEDLGETSYSANGKPVKVHFFRMLAVGRGLRSDKDRRHVWRVFDKAIGQASHEETRVLLKLAEQRRLANPPR